MNETNWEKVKYLPISSFILISIVFFISLYFVVKLILNLQQMKKFQTQEVVYYQNQNSTTFFQILWISFIIVYLLNVAFFITYLFMFSQPLTNSMIVVYYCSEAFFLVFLSWAIYLLLWISHHTTALVIVIKNQKLILLNETIFLEDVIKTFHDEKRKYLYIQWKDSEVKGNVCQVKIRYHYQIKDLLLATKIPTFFD